MIQIPGHDTKRTPGEDYGRCDDPYCTGGHVGDDTWECETCGWHYHGHRWSWPDSKLQDLELAIMHLSHVVGKLS